MIRALLDSDKPVLRDWISRDSYHAGMSEEFFYQPDGFSFAIDDEHGPVMYLKIEPLDASVARIHIQFDNAQRRRNAVMLARDWPLVKLAALGADLRYLLFDSVSDSLVRFCQKRFGFVHIADTNDYFIDLLKA